MEVCCPPILQTSLPCPHFLPKFTASTRPSRHSYRFRISSSKLSNTTPTASASVWLSLSQSRDFRVSAHFGRRRVRRNHLRKKLTGDQKVRLDNPDHLLDPNSGPRAPSIGQLPKDDIVPDNEFSNVNNGGPKQRVLGESVLWDKLESWVDQHRKDVELWGIGSGPIFTVVQDSEGNVKHVTVNEDEILKRSGTVPGNLKDVSLKILRAKSLAREMESGNNVIPRNSSVAKFVVSGKESGILRTIRGLTLQPGISPKLSVAGRMTLCGLLVIWAVKFLFSMGKREVKYTQFEKEMVRRKMKSRKEKEQLEKGNVEVLPEASEPSAVFTERPKLNKEELMKSIRQANSAKPKLVLPDHFTPSKTDEALGIHNKVEEIREMARRVREIEASDWVDGKELNESEIIERLPKRGSDAMKLPNGNLEGVSINGTEMTSLINGSHNDVLAEGNENRRTFSALDLEVPGDMRRMEQNANDEKGKPNATESREVSESLDPLDNQLNKESAVRRKPRIILSVKEAREYLSNMSERQETAQETPSVLDNGTDLPDNGVNENIKNQCFVGDEKLLEADPRFLDDEAAPSLESLPSKENGRVSSEKQGRVNHVDTPSGNKINGSTTSTKPSVKTENWMEENFDEVEPIVKRIGAGFRDNYMAAKEKVNQNLDVVSEMPQLGFAGDDDELEWMKDDNLREIVFQVQENELAGRDPFYSMDATDKCAFFEGLEKKVVRENEKLQNLHEFLHSNIENLDYGADGISLYDPPEKIIPRWKGPPLEKNPDFLKSFLEEREAIIREARVPYPMKKDEPSTVQESKQTPNHGTKADSSLAINLRNSDSKDSKKPKIVIEGSDGSVRAGQKAGKEYWQHTKKWSRGFLDSYNAEIDPEVKSVMKDIGKDLDRWITDKEIEEAADLMNKVPERNKKFIEKKLDKIKREMELFGPQAVVSKYKEYTEDEGEDHLWWLDLPHVLCIELYTMQDGEQKVGFYSLEMAADLELEPKPYHVIAFEDPGDCKNLCYIIQAHMEMLGNGHAFVVARPPKDAFRETKANGFGVTVIRKGELQLNVDQTLEEVEEQMTEIGSKIYHDAIMRNRSVDISALMKGVFGDSGKKSIKSTLKSKHVINIKTK
ncbi:hypothetical protein CDL15_Pgr023612 [Punica granatum]|uniref:Embryo defective 1703 n=1 Tax=Punica granatum TaxID=22663 RepID=A0A218W6Y7_PUNGR|nr:hypothetical protein CDL15_Pgr023612 [Punica granatum]